MITFMSIKEKDEGTLMLFWVKLIENNIQYVFCLKCWKIKKAPFYIYIDILIYSIHYRGQ